MTTKKATLRKSKSSNSITKAKSSNTRRARKAAKAKATAFESLKADAQKKAANPMPVKKVAKKAAAKK